MIEKRILLNMMNFICLYSILEMKKVTITVKVNFSNISLFFFFFNNFQKSWTRFMHDCPSVCLCVYALTLVNIFQISLNLYMLFKSEIWCSVHRIKNGIYRINISSTGTSSRMHYYRCWEKIFKHTFMYLYCAITKLLHVIQIYKSMFPIKWYK